MKCKFEIFIYAYIYIYIHTKAELILKKEFLNKTHYKSVRGIKLANTEKTTPFQKK